MATMQWTIEARDNASKALDDVRRNIENTDKATRVFSGGVRESGRELGGFGDMVKSGGLHITALNQALELGQKAYQAFGAAVQEASRLLGDGISMYRDQRKTLLDLERAYRSAGLAGASLAWQMEEIQKVSNSLAAQTIYGNDQIEDAIAAYQRLMPELLSVSDTQEDLNTILGIAYVQGMDATQAAELYARAAEGNVRGLERYTALTRDQVQQISQIPDASERARIATQALRDAYEGAALEADGIAVAMNRIGNVRDTILKTFGEAVLESQAMSEAFDEAATSLEKVMDLFVENQELISGFADDVGITLLAALRESTEAINTIKSGLDVALPPMRALREETEIFGKYAIAAAEGVGQLSKGVMAGIPGLQAFTPAVDMATQALTRIMRRADQIKKEKVLEIDSGTLGTWEKFQRHVDAARGALSGLWEELKKDWAGQGADPVKDLAERVSEARLKGLKESDPLKKADLEYERAKLEIQLRGLTGWEREHALTEAAIRYDQQRNQALDQMRRDREEGEAAAQRELDRLKDFVQQEKERVASEQRRNEVAGLRLQLLFEQDLLTRAEIERQIELVELGGKQLTALERQFEEKRIQAEFEARQRQIIDEWEAQRAARREEEHQRELQRQQEIFALTQRSISQAGSALSAVAGQNYLADIGSSAIGAAHQMRALAEAGAESGEIVGAAMGAGAGAVAKAAEAMGASTERVAGIQSLFETAQAAAAYASGNIPGGVAHTVAAGLFAAVAGGAGKKSGGGAGAVSPGAGSGSGSGSHASYQRPSAMDDHKDVLKQAHLEALREHDRGGQQIIYNIYQNNSTFFERDTASQRQTERTLRAVGSLQYQTSTMRG